MTRQKPLPSFGQKCNSVNDPRYPALCEKNVKLLKEVYQIQAQAHSLEREELTSSKQSNVISESLEKSRLSGSLQGGRRSVGVLIDDNFCVILRQRGCNLQSTLNKSVIQVWFRVEGGRETEQFIKLSTIALPLEEALFLAERGSLSLLSLAGSLHISIKELYEILRTPDPQHDDNSLFLHRSIPLFKLNAYTYLRRAGLRVFRSTFLNSSKFPPHELILTSYDPLLLSFLTPKQKMKTFPAPDPPEEKMKFNQTEWSWIIQHGRLAVRATKEEFERLPDDHSDDEETARLDDEILSPFVTPDPLRTPVFVQPVSALVAPTLQQLSKIDLPEIRVILSQNTGVAGLFRVRAVDPRSLVELKGEVGSSWKAELQTRRPPRCPLSFTAENNEIER